MTQSDTQPGTGNDALDRAVRAINGLTYDELMHQREQTEQYRQIARRWEAAFWLMLLNIVTAGLLLWRCYGR